MGFLVVTAVLVVELRPPRRHVRPRPHVQHGLRDLHRCSRSCCPSPGCTARPPAVPDHHADRPGRRRRDADRQLQRDPHRRLPGRPARPGARPQPASPGIAGAFIGLVLGGVLGPINWRCVFLVSVPFGVLGTVWSYRKLRSTGVRRPARLDWWGNLTFAVGLIARPRRHHLRHPALRRPHDGLDQPAGAHAASAAAWSCSPPSASSRPGSTTRCSACRCSGSAPSRAGNVASLLSGLGRGGLMFILIIWLQGIWLPLHGYSFEDTPLWAGIYMLPLTVGFLVAGPVSGWLSDRFGARPFATGGMVLAARLVRPARAAAGRLRLLAVRRDPAAQRHRHGPVRLAEPGQAS